VHLVTWFGRASRTEAEGTQIFWAFCAARPAQRVHRESFSCRSWSTGSQYEDLS